MIHLPRLFPERVQYAANAGLDRSRDGRPGRASDFSGSPQIVRCLPVMMCRILRFAYEQSTLLPQSRRVDAGDLVARRAPARHDHQSIAAERARNGIASAIARAAGRLPSQQIITRSSFRLAFWM